MVKKNARKLVSLTSLTPEEFEYLLPAFEQAYGQIFLIAGQRRGKNGNENRVVVEKERLRASNKNYCLH